MEKASTNINVRIQKDIKENAEEIFDELGINMSTAINMFLKETIRQNGIPFDLKLSKVSKAKEKIAQIHEAKKKKRTEVKGMVSAEINNIKSFKKTKSGEKS